MLKKWLFNILIGIDQLGNTLAGGDPDETISSRAGKAKKEGKTWAKVLCVALDWVDPGHCDDSVDPTEGDDAVF